MKKIFLVVMMVGFVFAFNCAAQTEGNADVSFERYESYFVKNTYKLNGQKAFLVVSEREDFDKVFGAAARMGQNHFLPKDAFESKFVVTTIKGGSSLRKYSDVKVTAKDGKLYVWYAATDGKPGSATFISPLVLALDKNEYQEIIFMENNKKVAALKITGK